MDYRTGQTTQFKTPVTVSLWAGNLITIENNEESLSAESFISSKSMLMVLKGVLYNFDAIPRLLVTTVRIVLFRQKRLVPACLLCGIEFSTA